MNLRHKIKNEALKHLGVTEEPAGSNKVLFNNWYYSQHPDFVKILNGAWCGTFVAYCLHHGGLITEPFLHYKMYYVPAAQNIMIKNNMETQNPKEMDIVVFDWNKDGREDHVGFFLEWIEKGKSFYTIEGNTSSGDGGSPSNGGGVYKRKRYVKHVENFYNIID